ncbi:MAG: GNAT family N-acetyltransferase [Prolixibacteraceae bacterium]
MKIQLSPVITPEELNPGFRQLYTEAFPPDERRDWQQLIELLNNPLFTIFQVYFQNEFAGFISIWKLTGFNFIEHFAIQESERDKGLGSKVLIPLLQKEQAPFILETEEPLSENSRRRIRFYEKLNFRINFFEYHQPPYSDGKNAVKMLLMSYPEKIQEINSCEITDQIHRTVYRNQD